ncbi:MBL fold metallo-hydrolase [Paenibacillus dakarensis]|uniref:MBL fold metallo-hydrolase n=1 Tax=Paenibacillus dakarensis TaxID=1527293 RepID=UPI0006D5950F|nr:MBL fold metallo-hydrolase [Paenibacillus dakarensis]
MGQWLNGNHMAALPLNEDGLLRIKITLDSPLRWVNSYLLQDEHGITLIDPGPRTEVTEQEWKETLASLQINEEHITSIVLTHHHPDHYGLAGWFQERTGAKVWMSERAHKEAQLMWGGGGHASDMNEKLPAFFAEHGMPHEWLRQIPEHLNRFFSQVNPEPQVSYIDEMMPVRMGGRIWLPVQTAGHAPGHLSFYQKDSGVILCGDAVLPQISPNISLVPGSDDEPLRLYLDGLRRLRELHVRAAYPGHRGPFMHFSERIDALLLHHEERLAEISGMLSAAGGLTGYEACIALFGNKLGVHQMRFAMCEALAHLAELVRQGQAELERMDTETFRFKPAK